MLPTLRRTPTLLPPTRTIKLLLEGIAVIAPVPLVLLRFKQQQVSGLLATIVLVPFVLRPPNTLVPHLVLITRLVFSPPVKVLPAEFPMVAIAPFPRLLVVRT